MKAGPVFYVNSKTQPILTAIQNLNPRVEILDRGSYVRVLVDGICRLTKKEVEKITASEFDLRSEIEQLMCSFQGKFTLTDEEATWEANHE